MNPLKKKIIKYAAITIGLIAINKSCYTVDQTEQAVLSTFGERDAVVLNPVVDTKAEYDAEIKKLTKEIQEFCKKEKLDMPSISEGAGLKFKLPWQSVAYFDRRMLEWDGYPERISTKDKKFVYVDAIARWYISNPFVFTSVVGTETGGHSKLDAIIDGVVRDQVTNRDAIESIRTSNRKMEITDKELEGSVKLDSISMGRDVLVKTIEQNVRNQCVIYGIDVKDFQIKRLVYSDEVKQSIENKMISERNRVSERIKSEGEGEYQRIMGEKDRELMNITSTAYRKAEEIKGGADKEATKIYAEGYNMDPRFYEFTKTMEILRNNTKGVNWILNKDDPLVKYTK